MKDKTDVGAAPDKIHFHLYLDKGTADWLRQEKRENFIPISASVALAVRAYKKTRSTGE